MGRGSLIASGILHVIFIIASMVGMPYMKTREFTIPPAPIAVDYIEISQVTETNRIAKKQRRVATKKPSNPDAPPPMPAKKKKPEKAAVNKSKEIKVPTVKPKVKPAAPAPKKTAKKVVDKNTYDENVKPKKGEKVKELKKVAETPKASEGFDSVLKNLMEEEEETFQEKPAINAPLGAKITISEQDALRAQLERCWNVPFGAKGVEDVLVEIDMVVAPDRTVRSARIIDKSRYSKDTFFRAIADSALRAVRSPLCSPLELPTDKYETWKNITVRFNPKDMF